MAVDIIKGGMDELDLASKLVRSGSFDKLDTFSQCVISPLANMVESIPFMHTVTKRNNVILTVGCYSAFNLLCKCLKFPKER